VQAVSHTDYQRVLGELLEEALLGGPVNVKVERLRMAGQERQAKAQD